VIPSICVWFWRVFLFVFCFSGMIKSIEFISNKARRVSVCVSLCMFKVHYFSVSCLLFGSSFYGLFLSLPFRFSWAPPVWSMSPLRIPFQCIFSASCEWLSSVWWVIWVANTSLGSSLVSVSFLEGQKHLPNSSCLFCLAVVMDVQDSTHVSCKLYKGLSDALICTDDFIAKVVQR
jgi:hypothetical protein